MRQEVGFNPFDSNREFFKLYEDYDASYDPMIHVDEKFYWTYQRGISWPDDYISPNSMTHWNIEKSQRFTNVVLLRISENIKA